MTGLEQPKPESSWDTCQGSAECMVIAIGGNVCERRTVASNSELHGIRKNQVSSPTTPVPRVPVLASVASLSRRKFLYYRNHKEAAKSFF